MNPKTRIGTGSPADVPTLRPKSADARWWEYYAVRYALGGTIGTPIVAILYRFYASTLNHSVQIPSMFSKPSNSVLWAAAGIAYCYIASVPMLTLHSTRTILKKARWSKIILGTYLGIVFGIIWVPNKLLLHKGAIEIFGFVALYLIVALQLLLLWGVLRDPEKTYSFYERLAEGRESETEYVESYRHMREHGNSISIVIFELLLAFVFWALKPDTSVGEEGLIVRVGVILTMWLAPASLVWLIGSALERRLANHGKI